MVDERRSTLGVALEVETEPRRGHHGHEDPPDRPPPRRRPDTFYASGDSGPSGSLLLRPDPGGPSAGFLWHVMALMIVGNTSQTTTAGTADVFGGEYPGGNTAAAADQGIDWIDTTRYQAIPLAAYFKRYQIVLRAPERLWAVITSPTANTGYIFKGRVIVEPDPSSHTRAHL